MSRDAFPGYDEPVNIEGDPEEVIKVLVDADEECEEPEEDE